MFPQFYFAFRPPFGGFFSFWVSAGDLIALKTGTLHIAIFCA
jgi:hypothetical protein